MFFSHGFSHVCNVKCLWKQCEIFHMWFTCISHIIHSPCPSSVMFNWNCVKNVINELTPKSYLFDHISRKGRGGGVAILYKKSFKSKCISFTKFKSFKAMGFTLLSALKISIFVVYRPPPSSRNKLTNQMFFYVFSKFLEQFSTSSGSFLLVGDFNFHVEDPTNSLTSNFLGLLNIINLTQLVTQPTYNGKHILDCIVIRSGDNIVENVKTFDPVIYDHLAVFCDLLVKKPSF